MYTPVGVLNKHNTAGTVNKFSANGGWMWQYTHSIRLPLNQFYDGVNSNKQQIACTEMLQFANAGRTQTLEYLSLNVKQQQQQSSTFVLGNQQSDKTKRFVSYSVFVFFMGV